MYVYIYIYIYMYIHKGPTSGYLEPGGKEIAETVRMRWGLREVYGTSSSSWDKPGVVSPTLCLMPTLLPVNGSFAYWVSYACARPDYG